ncbi:UPF0149 family protein [Pseudomonas sp. RL_15y_Pfl2_60]|uniref:UPF0149 family protein n=1 Tax=Pseudomonas sp. RL_15y_Pfl2_60 TaxID=3088709 RepID=UPI0030DBAB0E
MQDQPLTAADFDFIEHTLLEYGDDNCVLNCSELDGYFTALVSSPAQVDISEWFPTIWGGQTPDWSSPEQAKQFLELCVRHMNSLASQLAMSPQAFNPRFEQTEHQGQSLPLAEEWCFGYLRGAALANWPDLPAPLTAKFQAISLCAEQDNFEPAPDLDMALHAQSVAAIKPAALAIHDHWIAQR